MSKYVDGYILPVPKNSVEAYAKMAQEAGETWIKHGALAVFECEADDLKPNMGGSEIKYYPDLLNLSEDETVFYSFIIFESREHRDEVNTKVMQEMNNQEHPEKPEEAIFDWTKMLYGGFKSVVHLEK